MDSHWKDIYLWVSLGKAGIIITWTIVVLVIVSENAIHVANHVLISVKQAAYHMTVVIVHQEHTPERQVRPRASGVLPIPVHLVEVRSVHATQDGEGLTEAYVFRVMKDNPIILPVNYVNTVPLVNTCRLRAQHVPAIQLRQTQALH
jgi:hypothetical protein